MVKKINGVYLVVALVVGILIGSVVSGVITGRFLWFRKKCISCKEDDIKCLENAVERGIPLCGDPEEHVKEARELVFHYIEKVAYATGVLFGKKVENKVVAVMPPQPGANLTVGPGGPRGGEVVTCKCSGKGRCAWTRDNFGNWFCADVTCHGRCTVEVGPIPEEMEEHPFW
ncbi:hypothetical protein B6U82_01525 [Candidatus Pacearchaeota archaeon ex4484_31]|nr:MAG: hypothetical protein B6U82_01525 [Candidatus Pacearchaeota archaeon ex4484_31]